MNLNIDQISDVVNQGSGIYRIYKGGKHSEDRDIDWIKIEWMKEQTRV